jgi:Leucine-rich repeat (LRR) protein
MMIHIYGKALKGVLDIEQYCKDNDIDVEKVTNLKGLVCEENELTELKGLDKLVNLKWLYCQNNKLRELDVSKLVNLESLDCSMNQLTELDLSKLVNLRWLNCENNQLTELKGLDKLVNLEHLYCKDNKFPHCYDEELKGLDKLANLQWLNGVEYSGQIKQIIDKMDSLFKRIENIEQNIKNK